MKSIKINVGLTILEIASENYNEGGKVHLTFDEANALEFSDGWRLPTKDELDSIKKHMNDADEKINLCGSQWKTEPMELCWSSSESGDDYAYSFSLYTGGKFVSLKSQKMTIRCVRTVVEIILEEGKEYLIQEPDGEFVRFSDGSLVIYGDIAELKEDLVSGDVAVEYIHGTHK